ncbi:MAG TPA: competence/damage-inducible protein A [Virgibacillus sp.]|nr:competence/damage-inducible protein A [Virgibacillus sp.]
MSKQLKSEVIAIGTELLLGEIANTNAQWLSQQLASYGIDTYYHTVVGDNLERVQDTFKQAQARSDIIIVSGGLGPTEDDMTREAFQKMTGLTIVEHPLSIQKIEAFYEKLQSTMTPNNRRQARVFADSQIIHNELGMAPGMIVSYQEKTWIFLPGVPREMKQMAQDEVFPYIQKRSEQKMVIQSTTLKFVGIGESDLEHRLADLIHQQDNPTIALLAQNDGVVIRLTSKDTSIDKVNHRMEQTRREIEAIVGDNIYGVNDETLEEKVSALLKQSNLRISAAESVTGGMFTSKILTVNGASFVCPGGVVCYDPQIKESVLQVSADTIHTKGVVSEDCAIEMAENVSAMMNSDLGISFTGVAGPERLEGHPVGTVYIALYSKTGEQQVKQYTFHGDREMIRHRATIKGFEILYKFLKTKK